MSEQFLGEIRMVSFNFAPKDWAFCDGQLVPISQNEALFSLIGTFYGGNGQINFALPDLRGRSPLHTGDSPGPGLSSYTLGEKGGQESVALTSSTQVAAHGHAPTASTASGNSSLFASPEGNFWANGGQQAYSTATSGLQALNPASIASSGGSQPHENRPPYLAIQFIIALQGIFPSRN